MKRVSLLFTLAIALATSCSDETTVFTNPQDDIRLEANTSGLSYSVVYDNAGVLDIQTFNADSNITGKNPPDNAGDYPLTLIASISPPSYSGGTNLTASHVHLDGDYAFVSYNTVGELWAGAIDAIDISDPYNPVIASRLHFTNADISALQYNAGYLYVAGGFDAEQSATLDTNSFVGKIPFTNGSFNTDGIAYGFQVGFVGTDVKIDGNTLFVTSGRDGAIKAYNKNDLSVLNESPFADLRSVAIKDGQMAILDGSSGVKLLDNNLNITKEINITSDFGDFTKKTLEFKEDKLYIPEGSKGAGVYNASSGALIEYVPILAKHNSADIDDIVTNAIAANEDLVLMANGGGGLCLSKDRGKDTEIQGVIDIEGSINYVESKGDYIFAASGKKGLQIIKLNRPSNSLEARCEQYPAYDGNANLNIVAGKTVGYRGSKRFRSIIVNGALTLCGTWTVNGDVVIDEDALMEMNGTFVVGRNRNRKEIVVDKGATFRVEGNLVVYGDLKLKEGATLEFIGDSSVVNIFGKVEIENDVTITGTFDDIANKF